MGSRLSDYPLIRDASLVELVIGLQDTAGVVRQESDEALHTAFAEYTGGLATWSRGSCFPGLDDALAQLTVPAFGADDAAWSAFDQTVRQIKTTHLDSIVGTALSDEQSERLDRYFYANTLLVECLDLAYVDDRDALKAQVQLPPE